MSDFRHEMLAVAEMAEHGEALISPRTLHDVKQRTYDRWDFSKPDQPRIWTPHGAVALRMVHGLPDGILVPPSVAVRAEIAIDIPEDWPKGWAAEVSDYRWSMDRGRG